MYNRIAVPLAAVLMASTTLCAWTAITEDPPAPAVMRSAPRAEDRSTPSRLGDTVVAATAAPAPVPPRSGLPESIDTIIGTRYTPPAPAPVPAGAAAPAMNPLDMVTAALRAAVPGAWLAAVPVSIHIIPGSSSWSDLGVPIAIGIDQTDTWDHARYVVTHEWAHHLAFRFGSGAYLGAPPHGFPAHPANPAEHWAQCVAQSLLGYSWPSVYPDCSSDAMAWVRNWLSAGPPV